MKNIIFIAPSNAGKGTQADITKQRYNLGHISTGDLLREISKEDSELGRKVKECVDNSIFVTDEMMTEIIKDRISRTECQNGYILDGYPRTMKQLELYRDMLRQEDKDFGIVILIECPYEVCEQRVTGRLVCPNCKKIFHETNSEMKPKVDGICDDCGSTLEKRPKDTVEELKNKYETYQKNTEPLIEEFEKMGVLYRVDGSKGRDYTDQQVEQILQDVNKRRMNNL